MAPIRIVTDSSSGLPPEVLKEYGVSVVPISVQLGDETYAETDLPSEKFYACLAKGVMPKTAAPSPGVFAEVYGRLVAEGNSIISIHLSSKASSTCWAAETAKAMFPDAKIAVVDSRGLTFLLGFQVLEAVRAVKAGKSFEEVLQAVEHVRDNLYGYVVMPTLKYIQRSGRITKGQALLGSLLNIKPLLYFEQGELIVLEKIRTFPQAVKRALELVSEKVKGHRFEFGVFHGNDPQLAESVVNEAEKMFKWDALYTGDVGVTIASHGGPGMLALVVYIKD